MGSKRFVSRDRRELHQEQLVSPLPELGLVAANGPNDPAPELVVVNGVVTRMDGRDATEQVEHASGEEAIVYADALEFEDCSALLARH